MNGFLLMLRHTCDDCPVGLYETYEEALDALKNRVGYVPGEDDNPAPACLRGPWALSEGEHGALLTECSTPCNFSIVEFENGVPVELSMVAEYEDSVDGLSVVLCV